MRKVFLIILCLSLCACGVRGQAGMPDAETGGHSDIEQSQAVGGEKDAASFDQMQWEKGMELSHATTFFVESCGDYSLITIAGTDQYLLIPEGKQVPEGVPQEVTILQQPLTKVYLSSSSVFDLVREAGALELLRFSGSKKEDLCITEAVTAMEEGRLLFAGKYSKPDYELLLAEGCDLAIENTMIYHNPETKEKLESLGIPVLVETSSYEEHPFGRLEWIKLYGLLFDHLEEAQHFFDEKIQSLTPVLQQEPTGLKVAFFYVNSNGVVNVRKPGDYVAKMIALAGGEYVLADMETEEENALSTMNMQMEDFYLAAKDADIVIYNSTIVGEIQSIGELEAISPVFSDFKAVKEGRVYCTAKNFFQETTAITDFVEDLGKALRDSNETEFLQLIRVER